MDESLCQNLATNAIYIYIYMCIENRVKASAFRDIWARVMFFKFSKLHELQASAI